ncbi:hypothetical protein SAMN06265182_0697 [Persephonella hydrogeniphila]|uniref:Uncharacterized protein n=1 Tax=Persephonella hydrogeniphila TaxID=198703 RepID=A0A285NFR3_9AQUI|nr:hypothetical protein [Persephonella hydrogeniphila]SNZ06501.1 hypothetical protein SAMN06265182_0697 [Persephonella hydrogeniphila]
MYLNIRRAVLLIVLLSTGAYSQESFIDILHKEISKAVHSTVAKLDNFFADPRIKEETEAYLRFRAGFRYDSTPDFKKILRADFKIRLAKLEKRIGLFVESYTEKLSKKEEEEPLEISEETKNEISVGAEYKTVQRKLLKHRLSTGLTSSPKIYAKYEIWNIPIVYKRWEFTVYQRFRAERKISTYRLEESTQLYIDRLIAPKTVWRVYIDRYKSSNNPYQVVNYTTSVRFYKPDKRPVATEILGGIQQKRIINGGVNSYTVQYRVRANLWKKWAFFNVYTGVDWTKERAFKGTPFIKVFFEFYFGK